MAWTLSDIRQKVRKVTGRFSTTQLSNNDLDDYIDNAYRRVIPLETRLDQLYTYWQFYTTPNTELYDLPENFINFTGTVWVNGFEIYYFQRPWLYFLEFPQSFTRQTMAVGDGTTTAFATTATNYPIVAGSVFVTDNTETFTDDGNGTLTGDLGGTGSVNYTTGVINVTFNTAPSNGQNIYANYLLYQANQPQAIFNFNNQLQLYPIPDSVYLVKGVGYKRPDALTNVADTPISEDWGRAIVYEAAREIFADQGELDRYAETTALFKEQIKYITRPTLDNMMYERAISQN